MKPLAIAIAISSLFALGTGAAEARGCLKGAIVGGIAGHFAHHGLAGAAAGCAVGHHMSARRSASTYGNNAYAR